MDEFAPKEKYFSYIKDEKEIFHDLVFETKAESMYPAVACASVIARYAFIKKMEELDNKYKMHFHFGAGQDVDSDILQFVKKYGINRLNEVAKLHFKNTEIIKRNS